MEYRVKQWGHKWEHLLLTDLAQTEVTEDMMMCRDQTISQGRRPLRLFGRIDGAEAMMGKFLPYGLQRSTFLRHIPTGTHSCTKPPLKYMQLLLGDIDRFYGMQLLFSTLLAVETNMKRMKHLNKDIFPSS